MSGIAWTAEGAARARRVFQFLQLDYQVGTDETWDDVVPKWEREALECALGLPGAASEGKSLVEVCGPVGCGKDQLQAAALLALLQFGPKSSLGLVWSTKSSKSQEVRKAAWDFVYRANTRFEAGEAKESIGEGLTFQRRFILHKEYNSQAEFCSLDGNSSQGAKYDVCFLNELQDMKDPEGQTVYDDTIARRHKRDGIVTAWTNAPGKPKGDWRRDRWERAKEPDSRWHYIAVTVKLCPWIKGKNETQKEYLDEQRAELTPAKFKRLFFCIASDGMEDLATAAEIKSCTDKNLCAAALDVIPPAGRRFAGVDLSESRDHTSVVVLRLEPNGLIVLERVDVWVPRSGRKIDLDGEVEPRILHYGKHWHATLGLDPYNAIQMSQRLERKGCRVEMLDPRSNKFRREAAASVRSVFKDRRLRLYPEAGKVHYGKRRNWTDLRQQILDAELKEVGGTDEIVSRRTEAGHGDQLSAFANALVLAVRAGVIGEVTTSTPSERPAGRRFQNVGKDRYAGFGGKLLRSRGNEWQKRRRLG